MKVWILQAGTEYEGNHIESVHASEDGAMVALRAYATKAADERWKNHLWSKDCAVTYAADPRFAYEDTDEDAKEEMERIATVNGAKWSRYSDWASVEDFEVSKDNTTIPGVGSTGLDDGPYLPGYAPRKKAEPKTPEELKAIRAKAWATRRAKA